MAAAVLRHLAAFGPAGVRDFQNWSGPTRTRAAFEALRPGLRVYRDERGTELFDLPDAPLADPERPVPVRFLPAYDNLLLGHADRTRVVADAHRPLVMPGRALVRPTFLLDGSVAGTWAVAGAELRISPVRPAPRLPGPGGDGGGRTAGRLPRAGVAGGVRGGVTARQMRPAVRARRWPPHPVRRRGAVALVAGRQRPVL
ncbi:DNA glycosylase AlkZ-like family protein [Kitasatospora sp. NPDC088783]|uniref:DNA glycosylase AlkZ-like family protein n=1 Tax=Kitasatospora sp. NPDC088783 TaxID=3364077 RepID=UPI0038036A3D